MEAATPEIASAMVTGAYERGIIMETAGAEDEVVKLLPPLIITEDAIDRAIDVLGDVADGLDPSLTDALASDAEVPA